MPIVLRPPSEVREPLPEQLAALGRLRRRVAIAAGAFAFVGAVLGLVLAAGLLDAWLHLGALPRAIALVAALAAGGALWCRGIAPALRLPTDPLAIALELEDRYPRLNDSLASAVSFLGDAEPAENRGVSNRLRVAAVRKAERLAERHDFFRLVPAGRCWRAFWLCAVAVGLAAPIGLWNPDRSLTALARLADPFGSHPWPAKTRIELLAPQQVPTRIPKGDSFDLRFAVRGEIPDRATLVIHVSGGDEFEEAFPLTKVDSTSTLPPGVSASGGPVAVVSVRFEPHRVAHSFQFRIRANDADTGWQSVEVVPPPRLVPLDGRPSPQIAVVPPAYTGVKPFDLPDGAAVIEVPAGTVVSLRAAADVPLSSAVLAFQGDRSPVDRAAGLAPFGLFDPSAAVGAQMLADSIGADVPLVLSGNRTAMSAVFTPSMSGMYVLKIADETGLTGTRLIEIRLTADPAPSVVLLRPAVGRDPSVVVPEASIPIHIAADDRLYAIRRAFLEYRIGRDGQLRTIAVADASAAAIGAAGRLHPPRFETQFQLPASAFLRDDGTPVRDGDSIFLRAAADDWDDVSALKDPGRSGEVELLVASREAVEAMLQKELAALRPDLQRAREQQREAAQKASEAKPQLDGALGPADREKLMAAEQVQRQVRGRLGDPRDGLRARADMLREMARANGLPKSNATDRIDIVADELARMTDRDLAAIEPLLGDARQLSLQPPKPPLENPVAGMLSRAARHQKSVEDGLGGLIDLLSQWGDAGALRGDARLLRDAVLREAATADKLQERIPPGKAPESLPPDRRAELDRNAGKLDQLADQSNGLLGRAAKFASEKDKQAAEAHAAAEAKEKEALDLKKKAAARPPGTPERDALAAQAAGLSAEAAELKAAGDKTQAEGDAIRKAVANAGGQALPDELRKSAEAMRANRQGESATLDRSAAARLERLADSLAEKPGDDVPELARKKKFAANRLDDLAGAQDDLRKRAEEAGRIPDAERRADELKRLAAEQQKLIDQTRDLVQKLTRDRAEEAAKDTRAALGKMETARDDLERGQNPTNDQKDAAAKLDEARDKLDAAAAKAPRELTDEKRRKLASQVQALFERQKAAIAEADRIQEKLLADKKWSRPLQVSYKDLEDRERALAIEIRTLADREFGELPVFERVVNDAADAAVKAAEKASARRQDSVDADPDTAFDADLEKSNAGRVRRPMDLASRRLEQVLEALKPDTAAKKEAKPQGPPPSGGGPMPPMPPMPKSGGGNRDVIPPLAQLKALRSLQADLNARTVEFDRLHPNRDTLTDEDRDDLKELEDAQREITALFEQMAKLFQMKEAPPPEEKP